MASERELRKHLRDLVEVAERVVRAIDAEMRRPPSPERGARIAQCTNALELQKDMAERFGLGVIRKKRALKQHEHAQGNSAKGETQKD